ncbi:hypothetical protein [Methylomicrobium lacus]|uniref:hypothetical protein n=1 Tax=Methylomicrobium lacus TaxID=136992 RepID=UPI0035A8C275
MKTHCLSCLVLAAASLFAGHARAQVDPNVHDLRQRDTVVGVIYAPEHPGQIRYVEHWYLFSAYVYPGANNLVTTEIVPKAGKGFDSVRSFLKEMQARDPRGTYVEVWSEAHTR